MISRNEQSMIRFSNPDKIITGFLASQINGRNNADNIEMGALVSMPVSDASNLPTS